ncbi:MAG TPA: hypothetical protein VGK30_09220 [Candidatus Binatia bacterium]
MAFAAPDSSRRQRACLLATVFPISAVMLGFQVLQVVVLSLQLFPEAAFPRWYGDDWDGLWHRPEIIIREIDARTFVNTTGASTSPTTSCCSAGRRST